MVRRARDPDPLRRSGGTDDLPDLPGGFKRMIGADFPVWEFRAIRDHCIRRKMTLADFVRQAVREKLAADQSIG